jgi:tetrahydromethanopterin S-methyltransferase subunit H
LGGQPGEYPTVLIPSIFYDNQKLVSNSKEGEFNKKEAESLINKVDELSEKTGNPYFIDIMGSSGEALVKFTNFVSELTQNPFLIDSSNAEARLTAINHIGEVGLMDRTIYNSINFLTKNEEVKTLRELGVQNAIILAYNFNNTPSEIETILKGNQSREGLLSISAKAGIKNVLVDTAVVNVPSIGTASKAIYSVKEKFGLPAGCAPANALAIWKKLRMGEFGPIARKVCLGTSALFTQMMGANFIIQGPIEFAEAAFPACAMSDAIIAYSTKELGTNIATKNHPLYKIF